MTVNRSLQTSGLFGKSLRFDLDMLFRPRQGLTMGWRVRFIVSKYQALPALLAGKPALVRASPMEMSVHNFSDLGTTQSTLLDFHDTVMAARSLADIARPLVVDVGANIGQFTNAVKFYFPNATIYAFEPHPVAFQQLKRNTARFSDVYLYNVALGSRQEKRHLHEPGNAASGMSTLIPEVLGGDVGCKYEVTVERLDEIFSPEVRPDLVKIDVEGFELEVIQGGRQLLARSAFVLVELSLNRTGGEQTMALFSALLEFAPKARIVKFGRPLGDPRMPACQDVLIAMR